MIPHGSELRTNTVVYDGTCSLCGASVAVIKRFQRNKNIRFEPSLHCDARSMMFIEKGKTFTGATAVIRLLRHMRRWWILSYVLAVLPSPLTESAYDFIARNRYKWFSRCPVRPA